MPRRDRGYGCGKLNKIIFKMNKVYIKAENASSILQSDIKAYVIHNLHGEARHYIKYTHAHTII